MMSASYSDCQRVKRSSIGIELHDPEVVPTPLDGGHVDHEVLAHAVGDHRVARLVQRRRVTLALDVLDVVGRARGSLKCFALTCRAR